MVGKSYLQLIAVVILFISIKMYIDHRRQNYKGVYNIKGKYENISAIKHDMMKILFINLFPILVYSLTSNEKFIDFDNILESKFGHIVVSVVGFFIYYELIQPYVVNKMPFW